MESLGAKLKTAREDKDLSLDYIGRETNISAKYLDALEREDFSVFPGEPYALGFLRNYGEYLGIKADELLSLYRSLKIQEQPVPMEQLLRDPSPLPKIIKVAAVVLALLALACGGYFIFSRLPSLSPVPSKPARTAAEYTLDADFIERRFYPGDSILITEAANSYKLVFASLGDALAISTPGGQITLDLGQEASVDLNNDGFSELRIIAADFVKNDSESGALLRFEQSVPPQAVAASGDVSAIPLEPAGAAAGRDAANVVFTSPNAYPFTLQAVFQNYCLFRYEVLFEPDRAGRNEQYYQRSEEINISAQNGIRLGISNAQAVKLQVIAGGRTVPLETGGAGEVVAADLRWTRTEDNRYRLVLARLE